MPREARVESLIALMESSMSPKTLEILNSCKKKKADTTNLRVFYSEGGTLHAEL
ncbi:hypothetical protein [Candidatus Avelusimicrobium caledoniensis]|uniref:hypothetical protein n=1 Tax=Candidatus Avelusimicrobium caledoniensis TaxID=3416220 RepID=UPI003D0DD37F